MYICTYAFIRVHVCVCVHVERVKEKGWGVWRSTRMNNTRTSVMSIQLLTEALAI